MIAWHLNLENKVTLSEDIERLIHLMTEGKPKHNPWKSLNQYYKDREAYIKDIQEIKARIDNWQKLIEELL